MTEHDEQVALFERMKLYEDKIPELRWAYSIPNGGHRHKAVAAKMKAEGVKSGVPDICLPCLGTFEDEFGFYGASALYIEMKVGRNKPTANQEHWIEGLRKLDNRVEVCYSADEAWNVIMDYLGYERNRNDEQI